MKAARKFALVGALLICLTNWSLGGPIFSSTELDDPSNAVLGVARADSVQSFLDELFRLSLSGDPAAITFGGANLADIAAGSLVYNEEAKVSFDDWSALVDAFLIRGYLTSRDERERGGFAILIFQRETTTIVAFRSASNIEIPEAMK